MLLQNWMSKQVISIEADDTMEHAVKLVKEHNINMIPVMHHHRVVGVLSKIDLKRAHATLLEVNELAPIISKIKVKEVMTKDPITVPPDYTIEETAELMMSKDIAGLPVVAVGGELVGIITRHDLLKVLVSLSGSGRKGLQFAFRVEDHPGSIKELTDLLRNFGGRIVSILSTYEGVRQVSERFISAPITSIGISCRSFLRNFKPKPPCYILWIVAKTFERSFNNIVLLTK